MSITIGNGKKKKGPSWLGSQSQGMNLGMKLLGGTWGDGWMIVASVKPDLAAAQAGLVLGDAILLINGSTPLWTTAAQQLVETREKGLTLTVLRGARVVLRKEGEKNENEATMAAQDFVRNLASGTVTLTFPLKLR
jgi:S1-C subfamily serine protease